MTLASPLSDPLAGAPGATETLARFAAELPAERITAAAAHAGRRHFLDTIGAIIAGADQDVTRIAYRALAPFAGSGQTQDRGGIPGMGGAALDLLSSAYLTGTAAHGLEVDDGYRPGMIHPGSVVVPVALLLGARLGASGKDVLAATVIGYEIACRLAALCHPRARWRGFHPTSAVGVFAATATAGRLMGLDVRQMESAFGIAGSKASGIFSFLNGGDVKRLHSGHAAREGLVAAMLAKEGLIGPREVLEYKYGFFNAYAGGDIEGVDYSNVDIFSAGGSSGKSPFAITDCYIKPYACCRHIHPPIDAALAIAEEAGGLTLDDIEQIEIRTYAVAGAHGEVGWSEMTTAQMSMGFALATALEFKDVIPAHFDEAHRANTRVSDFCSRIKTIVDAQYEANYPAKRSAYVKMTLKDGRIMSKLVTDPLGGALNPLSDTALEAKFRALATPVLGSKTDALVSSLWALDTHTDVASILQLTTK